MRWIWMIKCWTDDAKISNIAFSNTSVYCMLLCWKFENAIIANEIYKWIIPKSARIFGLSIFSFGAFLRPLYILIMIIGINYRAWEQISSWIFVTPNMMDQYIHLYWKKSNRLRVALPNGEYGNANFQKGRDTKDSGKYEIRIITRGTKTCLDISS